MSILRKITIQPECIYPQYIQTLAFSPYTQNSYQYHGVKSPSMGTIECTNLNFNSSVHEPEWTCMFPFNPAFYFASDIKVECESCSGVDHAKVKPGKCNMEFHLLKHGGAMDKKIRIFLWLSFLLFSYLSARVLSGEQNWPGDIISATTVSIVVMIILVRGSTYISVDDYLYFDIPLSVCLSVFVFCARIFSFK